MDAFESTLSTLYAALGAASEADYEKLFEDARYPGLASFLYADLHVCGATFVVADNRKRRFVLLQEGIPEATDYNKVRLRLPIREYPAPKGLVAQDWPDTQAYSTFCNRIFQIQRKSSGLGSYHERLNLGREPEFLSALDEETLKGQSMEDWRLCGAGEMFLGLLLWRWYVWLLWKYGPDVRIGQDPHELLSDGGGPFCVNSERYFDKAFFERLPALRHWEFPEAAIEDLDDFYSRQAVQEIEGLAWAKLRNDLDRSSSTTQFIADVARLRSVFTTESVKSDRTASEVHLGLNNVSFAIQTAQQTLLGEVDGLTAIEALRRVHNVVHCPLPAYFYFAMADGRPKEHLIVPILRSMASRLVYYVRGQRKTHTAVVIALASLNVPTQSSEDRTLRVLRLKTILRICADRIVDQVFIKNLIDAENEEAREESENVLAVTRLDEPKRVFLLGPFGGRITFLAQQSRALMLVRALVDDVLNARGQGKPPSVAIIGGGIAGMTAACALAVCGCRVRVYEKADQLLLLQSGADHRFIHPHIAEWPSTRSSLDTAAGLPMLDWTADYSHKVTKRIRDEFFRIAEAAGHERLSVAVSTPITGLSQHDGKVVVSSGSVTRDEHDIAVVAVGFGLEESNNNRTSWRTKSYWEPDSLEKRHVSKRSILIAGSGDGGLIDAARAALRLPPDGEPDSAVQFDHQRAIALITESSDIGKLGLMFAEIDRQARAKVVLGQKGVGAEGLHLDFEYQRAFEGLPALERENILASFRLLKRNDTTVTLMMAREGFLFSLQSALVNRVLVFLMVQSGVIQTLAGEVDFVKPATKKNHRPTVRLKDSTELNDFDIIITRFGRDLAHIKKVLPFLASGTKPLTGRIAELKIASELDNDTRRWYQEKIDKSPFREAFFPRTE